MKFNRKRMAATVLTVCLLLCEANIFVYAKERKTIGLAASATGQGPEEAKQNEAIFYEKEFSEEGVKVTLDDREGIVPENASVSVSLIQDAELERIKSEIREKLQTVTEANLLSSHEEDQTLFGRYYDLTPVVEEAYALDFEITYRDDAGSLCVFEPDAGESIGVNIEVDGLNGLIADEMQEAVLFHNPSVRPYMYGSRQPGFVSDDFDEPQIISEGVSINGDLLTFDAEHFSVYTAVVVRYAASADSDLISAQERALSIINTHADPDYFLKDPLKDTMKESEFRELKNAAVSATEGCATQYDKIKAITEFVAERTFYDYKYISDKKKYPTNVEPYKVYAQKRTVCAGYARLVRTLLISLGIPCMDLIGNNHEYNAAYDGANNRWVFLDATWCSKNAYTADDVFAYGGHSVQYFDMTPQKIAELTSHETYFLEGLLDGIDNSAYYRMETEHDTTTPADDLIWRKGNWSLEVSGAKKADVKAAAGFGGMEVQKVTDRAFDKNKNLKTIDLSAAKLLSIGYASFYECKNLTTVKFPASLTKMDEFAFYGCAKLKKIDLQSTNLKKISGSSFYKCKSLKTAVFPASVKKIENHALRECRNLKKIDLSGTKTTSIGYAAFYGCNKAKSISIPSTVKSIDEFAFGCSTNSDVKTSVVTTLSAKKIGIHNYRKNIWGRRQINKSPYAYHVKFYANGAVRGTMKNMLCAGDRQYKISANKFRREGYRFTGWNTKKNGKGKTYKDKAKIKNLVKKNGKTVKLYAQWKKA